LEAETRPTWLHRQKKERIRLRNWDTLYSQGTTISPSESVEVALLRRACYRLLAEIPDGGLEELHEVMKRIIDFYAAPVAEPVFRPSVSRTPATLGRSYQRPDFYLDEE
jgi:hypothetical protein